MFSYRLVRLIESHADALAAGLEEKYWTIRRSAIFAMFPHTSYATNFSPNAARSARAAVRLAQEFHAHLTLLHVIENYSDLGRRHGPMEQGLRRLQELIPENAELQYAPERELEFGSASENILRVASDREADMIVLGARAALEVGSTHLPWSTAHHVLAHARC
jgi:nucleotide-binding universal stress UspA family protein